MRYRDKPELQDKLAAEFVLGTLRGKARLRFQSWMREDAALRRTVAEWQERLAPLALAVPEVRPPKRVWQNIEARIADPSAVGARATKPAPQPSLWDSLAFWRNLGLVTSGLAAALVVATALRAPTPPLPPTTVASTAMQPSYIATLEDQNRRVVFVAYAARVSDELWVKRIDMQPIGQDQSYELWALPTQAGAPPKSLGLVPVTEKGTIKLAGVADKTLADVPKLAISLEPRGGSKTGLPTGPVMYVGDCYKFW